MHVIFGATGTVGRHVLHHLLADGAPVRAASRIGSPDPGAEFARVDLATGEGVAAAVQGATTIFLATGDMVDQAGAEIRVIDAAARVGVQRIVKLSILCADSNAFHLARVHDRVEQALERSGVRFAILRPGGFMQNFVNHYAHWIRTEGTLRLPCGNARESLVDARDIAAVAAGCLRDGAADGRTLDLLGPEALTYHDMMAILSREAGGRWDYVPIGDDEFRERMRPYALTSDHLEGLVDMFAFHRSGRAPTSSLAIREIAGAAPRGFAAFAREHAHIWRDR